MTERSAQVSAADLGLLLFCAVSFNRRLPHGIVPSGMWDQIPQEWKDRINGANRDPRWEVRCADD